MLDGTLRRGKLSGWECLEQATTGRGALRTPSIISASGLGCHVVLDFDQTPTVTRDLGSHDQEVLSNFILQQQH